MGGGGLGEKLNVYRLLMERPEGKRPLEDQDIEMWIILRWILKIE
jgi:hypothetical protein